MLYENLSVDREAEVEEFLGDLVSAEKVRRTLPLRLFHPTQHI